jgi:GNAT superfamily N-acetyltransferase
MGVWAVEEGTFWAVDTGSEGSGLPPTIDPSSALAGMVMFEEIQSGGEGAGGTIDALAAALDSDQAQDARQRLADGRRCFVAKVNGQIAAYGWVTQGTEYVGELERHFDLRGDEAYIWDCVTLPAWRGKHLYSALLNRIVYRLHEEGVYRVWIGASRQNQPSIRGIVNAGFQSIADVIYRRFLRITTMWVIDAPNPPRHLQQGAYRILRARHEHRFGRLFIGIKPPEA